jgi:23S rRNA (adenine2503-C2)-methyltransferase
MPKFHLLDMGLEALGDFVVAAGEPRYRAKQLREWVLRHLETDFRRMSSLPQKLIETLEEKASVATLRERSRQDSIDGTRKWALETHDGHVFETVLIPTESRRSLCVSSQIGCAMGCAFCRTATMGFIRNLTLGEILEQVHWVNRFLRDLDGSHVTNVIFMGMGEPLHNLENVALACETLNAADGFGIGKDRITVSTSGIVPKILEWARRAPDFKLAISLNGSNDTIRSALMPVNRRWNIEALMAAADEYIAITGQKLTFEYILIRNRTCTAESARELKRIASHRNCKINLIPLNRGEDPELQTPSEEEILAFESILRQGDYEVLRRRARGPDILAACGQLAIPLKKVA